MGLWSGSLVLIFDCPPLALHILARICFNINLIRYDLREWLLKVESWTYRLRIVTVNTNILTSDFHMDERLTLHDV
jgi:hypothetical protein